MSYIAVLGAGSWGTTLACLLCEKGYDVSLWAFEREIVDEINREGRNSIYLPGFDLPPGLKATAYGSSSTSGERSVNIFVSPAMLHTSTLPSPQP